MRIARRFKKYITAFLLGWMVLFVLVCSLTVATGKTELSKNAEKMDKAVALASSAMNGIKAYKAEKGMPMPAEDKLQTGMVAGETWTSITSTDGDLLSKRTSTDPAWAAVVCSWLDKAGVKEGDGVVLSFSGSFPALNIAALSAVEAYGAKPFVMASVGASYFGATDPDFTFFDMFEVLSKKGVFKNRIDLVSFGGSGDVGADFKDEAYMDFDGVITSPRLAEEIRSAIRSRVQNAGVEFIEEKDFDKNIDKRLELIGAKLPKVKLFLNVGGGLVSLGKGRNAFLKTGYVSAPNLAVLRTDTSAKRAKGEGLLSYYHAVGVPTASMLNVKTLAKRYDIPVDPDTRSTERVGNAYYVVTYSPVLPIIGTALFFSSLLTYAVVFKKKDAPDGADKNALLTPVKL